MSNSYKPGCSKDPQFYVVKDNIVAKPYNAVNNNCTERVIRMGSLVEVLQALSEDNVLLRILNSNGLDCKQWVGQWKHLLPVQYVLLQAFQGITSPFQRIEIAKDEVMCNELSKLGVGELVNLMPEIDSTYELEPAIVLYKGPVPEMGPGNYFGLEILEHKNQGDCDGSICGKRYFSCEPNSGLFVALSRLYPYSGVKDQLPRKVYSRPLKHSEVLSPPGPSMPSDEKRVPHNNGDSVNYKTTLVLHLKEKDNMLRSQSQKVERTEKLIVDLEPSSNKSDVPLKLGDKVVWFGECEPEKGVVRWLGQRGDKFDIVGLECENPVGKGNGELDGKQLFKTPVNHAAFVPIWELVRADDCLSKPADLKKKMKNLKLIENCSKPKTVHYGNSKSQATNSRSLECPRSEHFIWSNPLVDVDVSESVKCDPFTNELTNREDNLCKSEYVFSESNGSTKMENKRTGKDSKNNNISVQRDSSNLSNYPIGEVSPGDYIAKESAPISRHSGCDRIVKNSKPSDSKVRHSYTHDLHTPSGDCVDNLWPALNEGKNRVRLAEGSDGQSTKLNNTVEPLLEIVGEAFLSQCKTNEVQDRLFSASPSSDGSGYCENLDSPDRNPTSGLDVGSVVEVKVNQVPRYGVIRWIGVVPDDTKVRKVAGIEMEEELVGCSDGTFSGRRYFQCNPKKALFVNLRQCQKDGRFQDVHLPPADTKVKAFGQVDCPVIPGVVQPVSWKGDLESICGKYRGIQGHHNSCYLDATLFSMFTFTSVFDSLLFRPPTDNDVDHYEEVQRVLREEIVNPLRQNLYVRADRVMKLRTLLENLSSVTGLTSEEKDPEEFLTSLVAQILRAEPFLKLSSGQEAYHYQLFVEKDEHLTLPSVQQLFDQSFLTSDIKLKEVPSCLIIQMPRFGKSFKMYPRILPSQLLDVTDIIEDSPRQCTVCGKLAEFECKECFGQCGTGLESIAFCLECLETAHNHQRRSRHAWRRLTVPVEFSIIQDHCHIPRLFMELFAVVCIETSHYVAFVKCGSGSDAPWCFFDSMADRKGEQNGYNIPEMILCPKLPYWLSDEGAHSLQEIKDDRLLPEHAKRLLCDAYMCMYQSPDVMMYR